MQLWNSEVRVVVVGEWCLYSRGDAEMQRGNVEA